MGQVDTTECPHCRAPRPAATRLEEGRIRCPSCDRLYHPRRWVADAPAAPHPTSTPVPAPDLPLLTEVPPLPDDLVRMGFTIVLYRHTMIAVSPHYGCSARSADITEVVKTARNIAGFIRYMKQKG